MSGQRFSVTSYEHVIVVASILMMAMTITVVSSLERTWNPKESRYLARRLAPEMWHSRNAYKLYYDMDPWKRAPSAGFIYGMRGKKVPSQSFFGMRGKKVPGANFLGMRGKKMSEYPDGVVPGGKGYGDSMEDDEWTASNKLSILDKLQEETTSHNEPQEEQQFLENSLKTNLGKINI